MLMALLFVNLHTIAQQQGQLNGSEPWDSKSVNLGAPFTSFEKKFLEGDTSKKSVAIVVGVQTGFTSPGTHMLKYDYRLRRKALRETWFPSNQEKLDEMERKLGIYMRFVIGHSKDPRAEAEIAEEEEKYGGFLRLPMEEDYLSLTNKTLLYFTTIAKTVDAQYIFKCDDDVYMRPERLPFAVKQWDEVGAGYIGCMKTGEILKSPKFRWWEPQWELLGGVQYFAHCWGSAYVLSHTVATHLASLPPASLRFLANEDTSVGAWMLAFDVKHLDDRRLCEDKCSASSIVVYDIPSCSGLCNAAEELPKLHKNITCRTRAVPGTGSLPLAPSMFYFDGRADFVWEREKLAFLAEQKRKKAEKEKAMKAAGVLAQERYENAAGID